MGRVASSRSSSRSGGTPSSIVGSSMKSCETPERLDSAVKSVRRPSRSRTRMSVTGTMPRTLGSWGAMDSARRMITAASSY